MPTGEAPRVRHGRLAVIALALGSVLGAVRCSSTGGAAPCSPGDADGIVGVSATFDLTVNDTTFAPTILKAQNRSGVTLTLTNAGTRPHGFAIDCLPTPNGNGCPATSCFGDAATIGPVAPDASATATFTTPNPEGIYTFRSDVPGDTQTGQFIVQ